LLFSYRGFNVAEKSDKSLNKRIKENLSNFEVPQIRNGYKKLTNLSLTKKVETKVADFDIRGAIKLLSSDDTLASFNEDVAQELKKKKIKNNSILENFELGIRRISDICLPAFLFSIHGVKKLLSLLLNSKDNELIIHQYDEALAVWDVCMYV
jgi:hypothetical protein